MTGLAIKICGVTDPQALDAAVAAGARFVGLVFHDTSPRHLGHHAAAALATRAGTLTQPVGVVVDPDDAMLDQLLANVPLAYLQLHGSESPERVAALRQRFNIRIIKALRVATRADLAAAQPYAGCADWLLFDAKPAAAAQRPGGFGESFDWSLLQGQHIPLPWLLAGGLDSDNVAQAVAQTGCHGVDVSSGVERRLGHKDPTRIFAFARAARHGAAERAA